MPINPAEIQNHHTQASTVPDNPLDAPDAPRTQEANADDREDEDMEDADDAPIENENENENENGGSDKDSADERISPERPTQMKPGMEQMARSHLINQAYAVIVPNFSSWFDLHKIHKIEKIALPEFFNSRNRSKTPAVYKDYRYFMVNTYRVNPQEYLTVTACRRNLAGDVGAILRVHSFLEGWGLINYQVSRDLISASLTLHRSMIFSKLVSPLCFTEPLVIDDIRGRISIHQPFLTSFAGGPIITPFQLRSTIHGSLPSRPRHASWSVSLPGHLGFHSHTGQTIDCH